MTVFRQDYSVFSLSFLFVYLFLTYVRAIPLLGQELAFPEPAACFIQKCTW